MHRPKKILKSEVVHKNPWYQVRQDEFLRSDGRRAPYFSIVSDPFVIVCALSPDKRKVCMVKNYRYPVRRYLLEFPMGWREKNETPLMAAKRELREETGLEAKKWISNGWFYLAPGISTQKGYIFIAERPVKSKQRPDGEVLSADFVSLNILRTRLSKGAIVDAPTTVALSRLVTYLQ